MNHAQTQTRESVAASYWFGNYLREKCLDKGQTAKLAKAIGLERKQIYKYASGATSPKLDTVAKILAYFGDFEKVSTAVGGAGLTRREEDGGQ